MATCAFFADDSFCFDELLLLHDKRERKTRRCKIRFISKTGFIEQKQLLNIRKNDKYILI